MYTGFTGESARSSFLKGHVDFIFSSISLSFQSKVAVFAYFLYGEFCPSTLVICPALFGVCWSIRELVSVSTNLCLMSWTGSQRKRRVCFSLLGSGQSNRRRIAQTRACAGCLRCQLLLLLLLPTWWSPFSPAGLHRRDCLHRYRRR